MDFRWRENSVRSGAGPNRTTAARLRKRPTRAKGIPPTSWLRREVQDCPGSLGSWSLLWGWCAVARARPSCPLVRSKLRRQRHGVDVDQTSATDGTRGRCSPLRPGWMLGKLARPGCLETGRDAQPTNGWLRGSLPPDHTAPRSPLLECAGAASGSALGPQAQDVGDDVAYFRQRELKIGHRGMRNDEAAS